MNEEKVTINIGTDTTELNQKLDESIKKASERIEHIFARLIYVHPKVEYLNNYSHNFRQ